MKALAILSVVLFSACASASHILVGEVRSPVAPDDVQIYLEPPESYDVIALVQASSISGWTQGQDTNNAVQQLKKETAKLGANGVLLSSLTEDGDVVFGAGATDSGDALGLSSTADVSGQAIFVTRPSSQRAEPQP